MKIREIIFEMRKLNAHAMCFYGHRKAINLMYGKPNDYYCEYSWSRWKRIDGKYICRRIHCCIPKDMMKPEIEKYRIDKDFDFDFGEYIIPERVFNSFMQWFDFDFTRTISDPYYMMVDCLETDDF